MLKVEFSISDLKFVSCLLLIIVVVILRKILEDIIKDIKLCLFVLEGFLKIGYY